jgi:hypothetical protein
VVFYFMSPVPKKPASVINSTISAPTKRKRGGQITVHSPELAADMCGGSAIAKTAGRKAAGAAMSDIGNGKPAKRRHVATGRPRGGHLQPDGSREHLYSVELADEICRRIANGETLNTVCEDPAIPVSASAVRQWDLDDRDGFSEKYASAKRQLIEVWSDQLIQIADNDLLEPNDRRVRIDTRRWLMSKLNAAKYGDKVTLAGDAKNPLQHVVRALDLTKLSGPELDALERFADARLAAVEVTENSKESEEQN